MIADPPLFGIVSDMTQGTPDALRKGTELSDADLVAGFREGQDYGQEVMSRVLGKIGLADRSAEPLIRKDGSPLTDEDGQPLRAIDYMAVATKHTPADQILLNFATLTADDPLFAKSRSGLAHLVSGYLQPKE